MGLSETADFCKSFAVMVRIQGPDPKGLKMRKHAFHQYHSGKTTLSASGMLLPDSLRKMQSCDSKDSVFAITVASVIEPFLSLQHRENGRHQTAPQLLPGVHIDLMVEDKGRMDSDPNVLDKSTTCWFPAQLLTLVDVLEASLALKSLVEASSGSVEHGWEVGWSLASYGNDTDAQPYMSSLRLQRPLAEEKLDNSSLLSKSTTRVAILQVPLMCHRDLPILRTSPLNKRADILLAAGSPFGILSPGHFYNSVSVGFIANSYPSNTSRSLLMADMRCLPGMEGAPVFGENAELVGILTRPLRQKISGAEVQLVIPWRAIATACTDLLQEYQNEGNDIYIDSGTVNAIGVTCLSKNCGSRGTSSNNFGHPISSLPLSSCIEKAMASICLVTIGDGIWASGVLLNDKGLILTNAHLLEPWRFGRIGGAHGKSVNNLKLGIPFAQSVSSMEGVIDQRKGHGELPHMPVLVGPSVLDDQREYNYSSRYSGHKRIRVRLDQIDPWIWSDARVVYICQGPLDIALLQLDFVPDKLCPVVLDFACPSPGSKAYVIGHGLFGPRSDIFPSASAGVVAKVVKEKMLPSVETDLQKNELGLIPAMLETTASVHPGGSGGAVVNSEGHMIGLVTSNARHGGGMVIPHLNFSIPCAVLEPVFRYSKDMQDLSLLQCLDKPNERLSSVWALMPPLPAKPDPSLPDLSQFALEDNSREGKGSRFAKFIADKQEIFKKPGQLGKVQRLSSDLVSSKL